MNQVSQINRVHREDGISALPGCVCIGLGVVSWRLQQEHPPQTGVGYSPETPAERQIFLLHNKIYNSMYHIRVIFHKWPHSSCSFLRL